MTATKQFIEDAIEGGWDLQALVPLLGIRTTYKASIGNKYMNVTTHQGNVKQLCSFDKILLDPKAWQAVGKTRGWAGYHECSVCGNGTGRDSDENFQEMWRYRFHAFVDFLADNLSIEEAIPKI